MCCVELTINIVREKMYSLVKGLVGLLNKILVFVRRC